MTIENGWTKEREGFIKKIEELMKENAGQAALLDKAARVMVKLKRDRDSRREWMDAIGGKG